MGLLDFGVSWLIPGLGFAWSVSNTHKIETYLRSRGYDHRNPTQLARYKRSRYIGVGAYVVGLLYLHHLAAHFIHDPHNLIVVAFEVMFALAIYVIVANVALMVIHMGKVDGQAALAERDLAWRKPQEELRPNDEHGSGGLQSGERSLLADLGALDPHEKGGV